MALKPNSIDCLIFSKDRAAQLDLLLRSIGRHAPNLYGCIHILERSSAPCFSDAYEDLNLTTIRHGIEWTMENDDFEEIVRWWLENSEYGYVSFLCDDDVFYRDAQLPEVVPWSFRGGDYDYPFSVDGNVYRREHVVELLDGLSFRDPTQLEALAHEKAVETGWFPYELPHGDPCLVGVPLNRVSRSSQMPHLGVHEYDLNERFLTGDRLVIPEPGDYGAHENLTLEWESSRAAA